MGAGCGESPIICGWPPQTRCGSRRSCLLFPRSSGPAFVAAGLSVAALIRKALRQRLAVAGIAVVLTATVLAGCGYHVVGRSSSLPSGWKTIAIPAFVNRTTHYRIEQRFTSPGAR